MVFPEELAKVVTFLVRYLQHWTTQVFGGKEISAYRDSH